MRTGIALIVLVVLTASAVRAQNSVSDGVRAFVRGDYPAAVRILRPLAEDAPQPDPLAQFFMAMMYASGSGVGFDQMKACGLYLASARPANPLASQARMVAQDMQSRMGPMARLCAVSASTQGGVTPVAPATTGAVVAPGPTDAGVDAFVRGDYARAFEVLQASTQSPWAADRVAEYFLGAMYENGLGVSRDAMRACRLYHRAATARTTALGRHTDGLLRPLWMLMGNDWFNECQRGDNAGLDNGFQPVLFPLEPGDWISWDIKGATIMYGGRETRIDRPLDGPRPVTVFLPLQHTVLATGPSRSTRRHFIELLSWTALRQTDTWSLHWTLVEIVRNTIESVAGQELTTVTRPRPPEAGSINLRDLVRLEVSDQGDAQWIIASGPRPRTEIIEPDAERQEVRAESRARADAESKFNPTLKRELSRTPELSYVDHRGCGAVFLHSWAADRTEAIVVKADKKSLQLGTTPQTFNAGTSTSGLEVVVHVYERAHRSGPFCTDAGSRPEPEESWRLTGGTIRIELSPPGIRRRATYLYRATVRIVDGEFTNASGRKVRQTGPLVLTAIAGTVSG